MPKLFGEGGMLQSDVDRLHEWYQMAAAYALKYGLQALYGVVILWLGWKLAGWASRIFLKFCQKKNFEVTLSKFFALVLKGVIMVFAGIMALDKFGITVSPLVATISAAVFGASFAFQAPLSNYAAGLSIIFSRPFVVGNTVTIKGFTGVVQEVKLPCTFLVTEDGERIMIPNKDIVGEIIVNSWENMVTDSVVGISYNDDPEKAMRVIREVLKSIPGVQHTPEPYIGIKEFGDSAIVIGLRYWAPTKDRLKVLHEVHAGIHKSFQKERLSIPYPQRDVHLIQK